MTTYAQNKKAFFDYEPLEKYTAGIELKGYEAKAIKKNLVNLQGGFVVIRGGEAYLTNVSIGYWQKANTPKNYEETRVRRLLLEKKELRELEEKTQQKGLTLVPIKLYNKGGLIKLEFALMRGKKKYDKREALKKREAKRKIERTLKRSY